MAYIQIPAFTKINTLSNDTEFVIVVDGVEHLVTFKTLSDTFGNTPELLAQIQAEIIALKSIIDALPTENPAAPIALKISDTPIIDGIYKPTEAGTYPNAGGLVYDPTEGITYFIRTNGIWTKDITPINFTPTGSVEQGNNDAVSGGEVFNNLRVKYVEWQGSITSTRLSVPLSERHVGMVISYNVGNSITGRRVTEQFFLNNTVPNNLNDNYWNQGTYWNEITEVPNFRQKVYDIGYKFPFSNSYISGETPMLKASENGSYNIVFRVPKAPFNNQILFHFGVDTMLVLNNAKLIVYFGGQLIDLKDVDYLENQIISISIKKSGSKIGFIFNGILESGFDLTSPSVSEIDTVYLGSYEGTDLRSDATIYNFSVEYDNGNIYEINYWNKNGKIFNEVEEVVNGVSSSSDIKIHSLPDNLYVTQGTEINLWLDNIVPKYSKQALYLESQNSGTNVRNMNRSLRYNRPNVGSEVLPLSLTDANGKLLNSKSVIINTVSKTAGSGTLQFLFCGDSTIDNPLVIDGVPYYGYFEPAIVQRTFDLFDSNKGFTPLYIGHKKEFTPYYHAGMSGWASSDFLNSNSPFWDGTKNNFSNYVQTVIAGQAGATDKIDFFIYQIGINDLKNNYGQPQTVIDNIKTLINQLHTDYPTTKVIVGFPASGCDETGFSEHFFASSSYRLFTSKMRELWQLMIDNFDNGVFKPNVYICNAGQLVDRKYGFPYKMEKPFALSTGEEFTHWDSVHPNKEGYYQMADAYVGRIKSLV